MIVLLREFLSGFAEHGAAGTVLSEEASRRVGFLGQLARDAGPALALPLDCRLLGVRLLPARRRQRGIVRRLRRSAALGFELGDAGVQRLHLRQQFVDPRQQLEQQRLQALSIERIKRLGRHPELESAPKAPTTSEPESNRRRGVSNYILVANGKQLSCLIRASELAPDDFGVWNKLGAMYVDIGDKENALIALRKARALALDEHRNEIDRDIAAAAALPG